MTEHALVIGEALIDEVIHPDGSRDAHPGGSPANVAIGLGRLGRSVELLAWIGLDEEGSLIRDHLAESNVELARGSESALHTSVATAVLDAQGVATYDFDLSWAVSPSSSPRRKPSFVHSGSIAAILPPGANEVVKLMEKHRETALITYDPNARPALMGNPVTAKLSMEAIIRTCDVVKVSDEDLEWLDPETPVNDIARQWLELGPALVVVTRGGQGASAFVKDGRTLDVSAPPVTVVDTVGAGDSFMSGLIDGLWSAGFVGSESREALSSIDNDTLRRIVERCVQIAAITVSRAGANPPTSDDLGTAPAFVPPPMF